MKYTLKTAFFAGLSLRTVKESDNLDELVKYAKSCNFCYRSYAGIYDSDGNEIVNICNGHR